MVFPVAVLVRVSLNEPSKLVTVLWSGSVVVLDCVPSTGISTRTGNWHTPPGLPRAGSVNGGSEWGGAARAEGAVMTGWGSPGLTDIHHEGRVPRKGCRDVSIGDDGQAPPTVVQSG